MSEVTISIDKAEFIKAHFIQRLPSSLLHEYKRVNYIPDGKRLHFSFMISDTDGTKDAKLRELNQFLGPLDKKLYTYVCSRRRTYL